MSQYTSPNTAKEFVERTLKIIEQYKNREPYLGTEYFDVTLYLNCMLGLVVLPREAKIKGLSDRQIPDKIIKTLISAEDETGSVINNVNFKEYIIGLRNGIVHFGQNDSLEFKTQNGKISFVKIEGQTKNRKHTLKYQFDLTRGDELENVITEILAFVDMN